MDVTSDKENYAYVRPLFDGKYGQLQRHTFTNNERRALGYGRRRPR